MNCPSCNSLIKDDQINIGADIARCSSCNNVFQISNTVKTIDSSFDISSIPSGVWYRETPDQTVLGATTRSPVAFFLVPFMLIWSGGSLGGLYGSQIMSENFDLFQSLFGIPFILGSVVFWSFALMAVFGKVELTLNRTGGKIFTGIGVFGITQRFDWDEIDSVSESYSSMRYPGTNNMKIKLEGKKRINFGTGLKSNRRYYILKVLEKIIYTQNKTITYSGYNYQ